VTIDGGPAPWASTETGNDTTVTLADYAASIGGRWQRGLDRTSTAELYDTGLRLQPRAAESSEADRWEHDEALPVWEGVVVFGLGPLQGVSWDRAPADPVVRAGAQGVPVAVMFDLVLARVDLVGTAARYARPVGDVHRSPTSNTRLITELPTLAPSAGAGAVVTAYETRRLG
jgi:hypothetical protein